MVAMVGDRRRAVSGRPTASRPRIRSVLDAPDDGSPPPIIHASTCVTSPMVVVCGRSSVMPWQRALVQLQRRDAAIDSLHSAPMVLSDGVCSHDCAHSSSDCPAASPSAPRKSARVALPQAWRSMYVCRPVRKASSPRRGHELLDDGGALLVGDGVEVAHRLVGVLDGGGHRMRGRRAGPVGRLRGASGR